MPEETAPAGASAGSGQPAPVSQAGPTSPATGRNDGGTSDVDSVANRDAIWAEAKRHYEPEVKKFQTEAVDLRKRLAKYEVQAKSAEQLQTELDQTRGGLERYGNVVKSYAESRVQTLPEHLQEILTASAGEDPLKALELLPKFEDLARKTQLKTLGGGQTQAGQPQIDFGNIQLEATRGNTAPLKNAYKLLGNGDERAGMAKYNTGLNEYLARGKR